jgi:signal transduction histidine kinase
MKPSFYYIVKTIIGVLAIILIVQLFWLKKLYDSIEEELSKDILQCIELSDQAELVLRMRDINTLGEFSEEKNISIQKSINEPIEEENQDHLSNNDLSGIESFNILIKDLSYALHQNIDSIKPINLNNLDSLIILNLNKRGIKAQLYYSAIIDLKNDSIIEISKEILSTSDNARNFTYRFTDNNHYGYIVSIEPLTYSILVRMSGILVTTLLIIIVLSFAFWYLIKTVLRQKTVEEMKDDFVNNITHELKTPIAVAYSAADTLLNFKQGDNKEKRDKYLTICKEQLSGLSGLVEQILSMSMEHRQTFVLNKEKINITDIINHLIGLHQLKSNKQIDFEVEIYPKGLFIYADRIHFNNIISNLIDNAIKYSGNSVRIAIDICKKDNYYIIKVSDNGIGIPKEKQAYIFDKFYRITHGNKYTIKGYGLGLFYVKTMVEKHDGVVFVDNNQNQGSTFTVKIPV